jgi:hypothetical protein
MLWRRGRRALAYLRSHIGNIDGYSEHVGSYDQFLARLGERETIITKAIIVLAGEYAQRRWEPKCFATGCEADTAAAYGFSGRLAELDQREWVRCHEELRTASEALVAHNWPSVEALAVELLSCGTIPGDEAVVIIECAGAVRR